MRYLLLIMVLFVWFTHKPISMNDVQFLKPKTLEVEVRGHLKNPGVFKVTTYSNFQELLANLELYDDSDYEHLSLTKVLQDQDIITINKQKEIVKVSINGGSLEELTSLKGVGEKTALRIIEYRSEQAFNTLEDLMNVKGIGEKIFQNIKDYIIL